MKKIILILILSGNIFLLNSCQNNPNIGEKNSNISQNEKTEEIGIEENNENISPNLIFEQKSFTNSENPEIKINILELRGKDEVVKIINQIIFEKVREILSPREHPTEKNYEELISEMKKDYELFILENPDFTRMDRTSELSTEISKETENFINILINSYQYTGGAHPNSYTSSLIIDKKTGNILKFEDLFEKEKLKTFAEKAFREKNNIGENESINSTGYMFENDEFYLSENVYFTDKGVVFFYNSYEIAPYVMGSQELEFSFDEIQSFLKVEI